MIMLIRVDPPDSDGLRRTYVAETKEAAMKRLQELEPRLGPTTVEKMATNDPAHPVRWVMYPDGTWIEVQDLQPDDSGITVPNEPADG